jgi:NADH:ubiquinone oxidoreductase subunit E
MEKKIEIKLCIGTLCYIMGGAELQLLKEDLPPEFVDRVRIITSTCLNHCYKHKDKRPPFVEIDGDLLSEANTIKIINHLKHKYSNVL